MLRVYHKLFNTILSLGTVPNIWCNVIITPIFKSGARNDPSNYRGICVSSCLGKLFFSILNQRLHLLLFISAKRTFICAKRCINNLYCTFLNTASNIIGAKRLSIAIFKYARAFNSINRQSTKRRDNHLGGTLFHVRAMKIQ